MPAARMGQGLAAESALSLALPLSYSDHTYVPSRDLDHKEVGQAPSRSPLHAARLGLHSPAEVGGNHLPGKR